MKPSNSFGKPSLVNNRNLLPELAEYPTKFKAWICEKNYDGKTFNENIRKYNSDFQTCKNPRVIIRKLSTQGYLGF